MKKIAFIIPWFGKLPNYFRFWLKTAEANNTIDFFIFTDNKISFTTKENIHIFYMTFEQIKEKFQSNFEFEISLNNPYKLCDYKPAYGTVFKEHLKGYDFWGHVDVDTFLGNIRNFITDDMLNKYDRILARGHLSLYRNTESVNNWYKDLKYDNLPDYKKVYSSNKMYAYDEYGGLSRIIEKLNIPMYTNRIFADLKMESGKLIINKKENINVKYFVWTNGELVSIDADNKKEVWLYLHYQKRDSTIPSKVNYDNLNRFYYCAPNLISLNPIENTSFTKQKAFELNYWKKVLKNKINRILKGI